MGCRVTEGEPGGPGREGGAGGSGEQIHRVRPIFAALPLLSLQRSAARSVDAPCNCMVACMQASERLDRLEYTWNM